VTFAQIFARRKANDVAYCIGEQFSAHLVKANNGSLIALSAPLCRSGFQTYRGEELGVGGNEPVRVFRPPSEVLSAAHLASIEAKPLTINHPSEFLTPENFNYYAVGHVQNVRRGPDIEGEVQVIGDLHVTDARAIDNIVGGMRDLSLGYHYDIDDNGDGTYTQRNLRCNHCAIVPEGRSGTSKIIDAKSVEQGYISSENEESPLLKHANGNVGEDEDLIPEEGEPMDNKALLDALNEHNVQLKRMFDEFKKLNAKGKDGDGCNCGGKDAHSDACPMYKKAANDVDENFGERSQEPDSSLLIPANSNGGGEGNVNPTARDCKEALNGLRNIRHVIATSGDRRAIDAYNNAVIDVKKKLADALMRGPAERVGPDRQVMDAHDKLRADGADYEATCRNLHREDIPSDPAELQAKARRRESPSDQRRVNDTRPRHQQVGEDFEDSVKAAREKALRKK
jgi:hypothetical protein